MNIVQEIIAAMLKANYFDFFENSLSEREKRFIKNLNTSHFKKNHLVIEKTLDGKQIISWSSAIGKTVAFHFTDGGFFFSGVEIYNEKEKSMRCGVDYHFPGDADKAKCLENEINEIKEMFLLFSVDAEVYFK